MQQVVNRRQLVVLVVVQTFLGVPRIETELLQHFHYFRLDRDHVFSYDEPLVIANWLELLIPRVVLNVSDCVSRAGVCVEYFLDEVFARP